MPHAVLELALAAISEEAGGPFKRTKFNIYFRVTPAVRFLSDASMRGPGDFFFEWDLRKLGKLWFGESLFGGDLLFIGFHVWRHLAP